MYRTTVAWYEMFLVVERFFFLLLFYFSGTSGRLCYVIVAFRGCLHLYFPSALFFSLPIQKSIQHMRKGYLSRRRPAKAQTYLQTCSRAHKEASSKKCMSVAYTGDCTCAFEEAKKVREKSREFHNHKPQPFPDPKRKRKPTNPNKQKSNKRKSTKINSLFPKRGNRNTKRTEKHKNKMTHGKTYNKSPRRINHKATKTGTTALERSVE